MAKFTKLSAENFTLVRWFYYLIFQFSPSGHRSLVSVILRTALFWAVTQHVVVNPYQRFGTTYRSHIQGSGIEDVYQIRNSGCEHNFLRYSTVPQLCC
jgi:hypothetical protein